MNITKKSAMIKGIGIILIAFIIIISKTTGQSNDTVTIGNQVWMVKNLDVNHYRNGDAIFHAKTRFEWKRAGEQGIGAWCYYDNARGLGTIYGKLYNWYAVNDPRGLAPSGWRVTSYEDWEELVDYYGGFVNAGGYLKSSGTSLWNEPNEGANNLSGFTGLPGGGRKDNGDFYYIRSNAYWWSSEEYSSNAWYCHLPYHITEVFMRYKGKSYGFSVRCIKDE